MKEGFSQLVKRYVSCERPDAVRGILAFSISKIENDGSKALAAKNERELHSAVQHVLTSFTLNIDVSGRSVTTIERWQ
jgi:hypothetical protein